jgi:hypothetical protein
MDALADPTVDALRKASMDVELEYYFSLWAADGCRQIGVRGEVVGDSERIPRPQALLVIAKHCLAELGRRGADLPPEGRAAVKSALLALAEADDSERFLRLAAG